MKCESDVWNPKHLLPFIMSGEEDELLTYFPEVAETFYRLKSEVQAEYIKLLETWLDNHRLAEQKEFALAIAGKTPFTSVLFNVRKKNGELAKAEDFKRAWREAEAAILKRLKSREGTTNSAQS
jgi:hypothetical protein